MVLTLDDLNANVRNAQYAVRGSILQLAEKMEREGKKIHYFNIGNPQQLGQPSLTYFREVLSLLHYPSLLKKAEIGSLYSQDSIARAKSIMDQNPVGLGAYSQSAGIPFVRQAVADFITRRDNIPAESKDVFMLDGASKGVDLVLQSLITKKADGIMIPIPQYPLYSADITLFGGTQVPYYLDEENDWKLRLDLLEESILKSKSNGINIKAIVVINPNNPTGGVFTKRDVEITTEFADQNDLGVIADEVYQENVYHPEDKFHSFAKTVIDKEHPVPLFSLHSTSKGFIGECGYRGGFIAFNNIPDDFKLELLKLRSIGLCPNTSGQIMTYLMVTPPTKEEKSFSFYLQEKNVILDSLARKAKQLSKGLNAIDGISCNEPRGAMYLFPKLEFPSKDYNGKPADYRFCEQLVLNEGIVTVPGSGFGQLPRTHHLRMTILPPEEDIPKILEKISQSYQKFVNS